LLMMKKITESLNRISRGQAGDTIVEVLIAIAVAAFAIGTSYAIANRSIQRAITARERNEATNTIQSQISALKFREKFDPAAFNSTFGVPTSFAGTGTARHFCLNTQSTGPSDSVNQWGPYVNNVTDSSADTLSVGSSGYFDKCRISTANGTEYYIDISATVTTASRSTANNPTVYRAIVRWMSVTGELQKSIIYYRIGGV
jgi:type II secretory pathway pseudopilin PulG